MSQKVAVEIPYDLQTWHFTVPSPAELGDVGGGPRRVLGSSRQLCEAGPGDRGRRFHVGNGAAGRVVAPRKPGLFLRLCLPLATGTSFGDLIDRGRVLTHDLDRSTFPPFRGLRRRGSSETTISFKRLPIKAEVPWYCPPFYLARDVPVTLLGTPALQKASHQPLQPRSSSHSILTPSKHRPCTCRLHEMVFGL